MKVLLIEASGDDNGPSVMEPIQWPSNLGGERDWAFASVMPRVTTGNTMAPCVVIGERAAEIIRHAHGI